MFVWAAGSPPLRYSIKAFSYTTSFPFTFLTNVVTSFFMDFHYHQYLSQLFMCCLLFSFSVWFMISSCLLCVLLFMYPFEIQKLCTCDFPTTFSCTWWFCICFNSQGRSCPSCEILKIACCKIYFLCCRS